jgi:NDP-sugar pyrophosphorylase family protein
MTTNFSPSSFFSLAGYSHVELFERTTHVWEALVRLSAYLGKKQLGNIETDIPAGVHLVCKDKISIGKGTVVEPGAYISGPCLIGKNCIIRQGAYIRGNVVTGDGCVIGHATEIKHSILLDKASAAHFNYVGDSILGNGVNLGAGVKLANYKLDHTEICIFFQGEKISTKLKKFGAVLGDGVQLGCNAVTSPGTLMGPGALCYPCVYVKGIVPSKKIIKDKL